MFNLVLFGPPGSGKGTQSDRISERYNLRHISTGDIFRKEMDEETPLGLRAKKYVEKGDLVPDELVVDLVMKFLDQHNDEKGFIFDGFPRTIRQAEILRSELFERGETIKLMIDLKVPEAELLERMRKRGLESGRADDQNEDVLQNRLQTYRESTEPVITFYTRHHKHYDIDGVGTVDEVFNRISCVIEQFI